MFQIGKNLYQWHGITHQLKTLAWLKQLAEKLNMLQRYHDVKQIEAAEESSAGDSLLFGSSPCNGQVGKICYSDEKWKQISGLKTLRSEKTWQRQRNALLVTAVSLTKKPGCCIL